MRIQTKTYLFELISMYLSILAIVIYETDKEHFKLITFKHAWQPRTRKLSETINV